MIRDLLEMIPVSHPSKEGSLQASKWLHLRMLIDPSELKALLTSIDPLFLVNISTVCRGDEVMISSEQLIALYEEYIVALQQSQPIKHHPTWGLSKTLDPFYLMELPKERYLVKLKTPIIRVQRFHFHHIAEQNEFILTHHAERSISWGLEFSFPQFYQDHVTCLPHEILKDLKDPNTQMFKSMQKWMRDHTLPVPFIIEGQKKIAPFRLGKKCFEWINLYRDLRNKGLEVYEHRSHYDRQ